jgi:dihydrofolate reductase
MKVILLMTISVDGYIARVNDEAPWSPEEFARCNEFIKQAGNVIVGRRTYEIMKAAGDFDEEAETVVLSKGKSADIGKVHFVSSPKEALEYLDAKRFQVAVVGGGRAANTAFLDAGLLNEIILDVEPIMLGEGLTLFSKQSRDIKMKVLGEEKLDADSVRLHYALQ